MSGPANQGRRRTPACIRTAVPGPVVCPEKVSSYGIRPDADGCSVSIAIVCLAAGARVAVAVVGA